MEVVGPAYLRRQRRREALRQSLALAAFFPFLVLAYWIMAGGSLPQSIL